MLRNKTVISKQNFFILKKNKHKFLILRKVKRENFKNSLVTSVPSSHSNQSLQLLIHVQNEISDIIFGDEVSLLNKNLFELVKRIGDRISGLNVPPQHISNMFVG